MTTTANYVPLWTFGDKVRKVRRDHGLSQTEFGARIGVKGVTVGSWEAGSADHPRGAVEAAKNIEREFGTPATWLLGLSMTSGEYIDQSAA